MKMSDGLLLALLLKGVRSPVDLLAVDVNVSGPLELEDGGNLNRDTHGDLVFTDHTTGIDVVVTFTVEVGNLLNGRSSDPHEQILAAVRNAVGDLPVSGSCADRGPRERGGDLVRCVHTGAVEAEVCVTWFCGNGLVSIADFSHAWIVSREADLQESASLPCANTLLLRDYPARLCAVDTEQEMSRRVCVATRDRGRWLCASLTAWRAERGHRGG